MKKGTKFRLTIDYRKLNEVIVRQVWPMPLIDDLLNSFHEAKYFTIIDLEAAFYQIELKPESRELTAFITQDGLYEFNVLPMGLGNSPAVMQRLMDSVLRRMSHYARGYMDNIIIFSNTFADHCVHLENVLNKLRENKLTMSPPKTKVAQSETRYCSFRISRRGICMVSNKVTAINAYPSPSEQPAPKKMQAAIASF